MTASEHPAAPQRSGSLLDLPADEPPPAYHSIAASEGDDADKDETTPATPRPPEKTGLAGRPSAAVLGGLGNPGLGGVANDPRSSSMQSLITQQPAKAPLKRQLLLVYVHGFMGSETSFASFPAHVHNAVDAMLGETHVVHTKIYPRYKTRKPIQVATEEFGTWLAPHETHETDIILLGHSMGGLLISDLALLKDDAPAGALKHRVLGTINFDSPFLGMHPGIIKSGLGSLFRGDAPAPPPQLAPDDAAQNRAYFIDAHMPVRSAWRNAAHFVSKHHDNLFGAARDLITSHVDFGSSMADYEGLQARYCRIRMLEEDDPLKRATLMPKVAGGLARAPPRVRFANFYTVSSGRPKAEAEAAGSETASAHSRALSASENDSRPDLQASGVPVVEDSDSDSDLSDLTELDPFAAEDLESHFDDGVSVDESVATQSVPGSFPYSHGPRTPTISDVSSLPDYEPPTLAPPGWTESATGFRPTEKHAPPRTVADEAYEVYAAEQAAMPPEPVPVGPPPSMDDYPDLEAYRQLLSEHGRASQAYFNAAKAHQRTQYERFVADSKARSAAYHDELRAISNKISEEARRYAEAVTENARIETEIAREQAKSHAEHRQAVAEHDRAARSRGLSVGQPGSSASHREKDYTRDYERGQRRLSERQVKIERKLERHRAKLEADRAKVQRKLEKYSRKAHRGESRSSRSTRSDTSSALGRKDDVLFDVLSSAMSGVVGSGSANSRSGSSVGASSVAGAPRINVKGPASLLYLGSNVHGAAMATSASPSQRSVSRGSATASAAGSSASHPGSGAPSQALSQLSLEHATSTQSVSSTFEKTDAAALALRQQSETDKPRIDRTFCVLPPAYASGRRDPTWMPVRMQNMDEVAAHTSLFFASTAEERAAEGTVAGDKHDDADWTERYTLFVTSVASLIEAWVGDEASRRLVESWAG